VKIQDQVNEEQGDVQDLVAEEGAVHDQVPVDEGGGMTKAVHDETPLDQEADVADNMAEAGGDVLAQVDEEDDMTNVVTDQGVPHANEGDGVPGQDGAADDPVDQGHAPAELTKQFGTAEGLHTMEEILMTKQDWFDHAAADGDVAVAKYEVARGDGIVNAPVEKVVDLTKVVEDQGDVHVSAHIDEGGGPVEIKPAVDKDEEGGGGIPTPEDREAGRLGIMMTKSERFGHERGGGIAKCTRLLCCAFMLVGNAGKLGPRGRSQAHLTAAP
jgi:hypothetical protein